MENGEREYLFYDVLKNVQEYITKNYSIALKDNEENAELIKSYIQKYIDERKIKVKDIEQNELCDLLYGEMTGFSFLTKYLSRDDVEEININQWNDVKITYADGDILPCKEKFLNAQHCIDVIRRILHKSGMILDNAQPIIVGHLSNKIRITAIGNGVIDNDKGVSCSIRIVNPKQLAKKEFVDYGTATEDMLNLLSVCCSYGVSMCVTGATSSGKTTLMSWLLSQIPDNKRIFTIENGCREFDLTKYDEKGNVINNVVHTVTRHSDDIHQNISQVKLLETALTMNPDVIVVAEMKGEESFYAQESARTGHLVVTTIHANSCEATYQRMVTLCKQKYDMEDLTLYNLVTEAFPIVVFTKKLEDRVRRIMEITECIIKPDGKREIRTLYRFNITDTTMVNDKVKIIGHFEKVNNISETLQRRLRENGMPLKVQEKLLKI